MRPGTRKMLARAQRLMSGGKSQAEVARRLGINAGWLSRVLAEDRRERQQAAINGVVRVGGLLSNAAYNLAQGANLIPLETKRRLDELRREWDGAVGKLRSSEWDFALPAQEA